MIEVPKLKNLIPKYRNYSIEINGNFTFLPRNIFLLKIINRLIEKSHQTAEQRNDVLNDVSGQTAQKILELEKQKVELTNDLSLSTSKISDLQLQLNQYTQDTNENQSRVSSLTQKCEQYKNDFQKSESQRLELQTKVETLQEQYKNEKLARKQLQNNLSTLEEELAELKIISANFDKVISVFHSAREGITLLVKFLF